MEFEGKSYEASFSVESGVVTVEQKGANADVTAGMLFRELLEGAKARGRLLFSARPPLHIANFQEPV